jgi:hypothetical protein
MQGNTLPVALTPTQTNPGGKARPSAEDEVIIREIDEAVRQDDTAQFLKKYGVAVASVLGLILAGLAAYLIWDAQVEASLEQDSEKLVRAIDYLDAEDWRSTSERSAELLDDETPGVRTSARFMQAGAALAQGETDRAVELYAQVSADADAPPALRDFARVREVAANFDARKPADVIAKLRDLAVPGNPFFGSAGELVALAHLEAGDRKQAGALFAAIAKDEDLPETLRSRARQMAGLLGVDAVESVEQVLKDEGIDIDNPGGGLGSAPAGPVAPPAQAADAPQ